MDHPRPNLRYVAADDLDDKSMTFDGLEVSSHNGEKLGKLEGFIVDVLSGRPYHVVVGSGGLFAHKHFLLPVGHVALSPNNDKVIADVTRERVERYPGFDKDEFEELSDDDLRRMTDTMSSSCCPDETVAVDKSQWDTTHYAYPTWWQADFYRPDRADRSAMDVAGAGGMTGAGMPSYVDVTESSRPREQMRASETTVGSTPDVVVPTRGETDTVRTSRETVRADEDTSDPSPHLGGRAQPGDVLGVETGGERTYMGDTSEDENKRRRDAEEAARKK